MDEPSTLHDPALGLGPGRGDLVAQVNAERLREAEAEARARRKRRTKAIAITLVSIVVLLASAAAAYVGYDRYRQSQRLATAESLAWSGDPSDLAAASSALLEMLEARPEAPRAKELLAVVRALQVIEGFIAEDEAEAAVADAVASGDSGALAQAILGALHGESPAAEVADESPALRAWLRGLAALSELDDAAVWGPAVAELRDVPARTLRQDRVFAALLMRTGHIEEALEVTAAIREGAPADAGAATDWSLYRAVVGIDRAAAEELSTWLVASAPSVSPRDKVRAYVAQAALLAQRGQLKHARQALAHAQDAVLAWDVDTADHALELALTRGWTTEAEAWLRAVRLSDVTTAIAQGWLSVARGRLVDGLERLAKTPQADRRTAQAQALALVDQGRFVEAKPWLARAMALVPQRTATAVAQARVDLVTTDGRAASEAINALAAEHPYAVRVWTARAEALARSEPPADAKADVKAHTEALQDVLARAVDREPHPAEAELMLAELLRPGARTKAQQTAVLSHLRAAVEHAPDRARFREGLGAYQAQIGQLRQADVTLGEALDLHGGSARGPIVLAQLHLARAVATRKTTDADVETWLQLAAERGATEPELQREWARYELAQSSDEALGRAVARLSKLVADDPRDVEVREMHVRALDRSGDDSAARQSGRAGLRRTPRSLEGPIYMALADVEARKSRRRAAQLAFRGWGKLADARPAGFALVAAADQATRYWLALGEVDGARAVVRDLTAVLPLSAEAWALRGRIQSRSGEAEAACESVEQAKALDAQVEIPKTLGARC